MFVMSQDKKQIVELTGSTVMIMDYRETSTLAIRHVTSPQIKIEDYPVLLVAFGNDIPKLKISILGYFKEISEAQEELEALFAYCGTGGTYAIRSHLE